MKHFFWKTSLSRVVALCLFGCCMGARSTLSTSNDKECRDDPKISWCLSMKDFCHLEAMEESCRRTCKYCTSKNSTDCASMNCEHSCSSNGNDDSQCACRTGYELRKDGRTCADINECTRENPCPGDKYECVNTKGSYRCEGRCTSDQYKKYKLNKCCQATTGDCGINSENGGPRVGGDKGMVTRWPWMTLITFESSSPPCAGILVDSSWVLTTGDCVKGQKPRNVRLAFGIVSTDFKSPINDERQRRVADKIYVHPKFDDPHNDVALIKLNKDVKINDFVRPNCLAHGESPVVSQNCWALGYASESDRFANLHRVLHQETVTISKPEKCNGQLSQNNPDNMMCVSHQKRESKEDCQGGTGGPLVCQRCSSCGWYVAGFASQEISCRFTVKSSNFTMISKHELWIGETMGLAGLRSAIAPSCKPPRKVSDWSSWGSWSGCSVTCGNGTSRQQRICRVIERGTSGCRGDGTRTRVCQRQACKPDEGAHNGQMLSSVWGEWSKCSSTCGKGRKFRYRSCVNRNQNAKPCRGRERDMQTCNTQSCPKWSKWSKWEPCSVTCGRGKTVSRRSCLNGEEGDRGCIGRSVRARYCRKKNCPGWTSWSSWSSCSVSCGEGTRSSSRECRLWTRSASGCAGNSTKTKTCEQRECEECTKWTSWSTCSTTCGVGIHRRSRHCHMGSDKETDQKRTCRSSPCPSEWLKWSSWSRCSVSCGGGAKTRGRRCTGSSPGQCSGPASSTEPCNQLKCPADDWSDWSAWSKCDVTCGTGLQTRRRKCKQKRCSGPDTERKLCGEESCTKHDKCDRFIDGWPLHCHNVAHCGNAQFWDYCGGTCCREIRLQVYTKWSDWSSCSSTCGGGWQERERSCRHNAWCNEFYQDDLRQVRACNKKSCFARQSEPVCSASCGGGLLQRNCLEGECSDGQTLITEACNTEPCINELSDWTEWSDCSTTCGNGTRDRVRNCTGDSCETELLQEMEQCNLGDCGVWSGWKYDQSCSASCGVGSIKKRRICMSGSCDGKSEEDELCVGDDCPSVSEYSICEDDPAMRSHCQLLRGNCDNGYMTYACRRTCGLC